MTDNCPSCRCPSRSIAAKECADVVCPLRKTLPPYLLAASNSDSEEAEQALFRNERPLITRDIKCGHFLDPVTDNCFVCGAAREQIYDGRDGPCSDQRSGTLPYPKSHASNSAYCACDPQLRCGSACSDINPMICPDCRKRKHVPVISNAPGRYEIPANVVARLHGGDSKNAYAALSEMIRPNQDCVTAATRDKGSPKT